MLNYFSTFEKQMEVARQGILKVSQKRDSFNSKPLP